MNPISSTLKALLVYCCMCCYLWISYFYSYINKAGRAGFVMSSQASSAGRDEATVRRKLVESGHVDVMVAIRSNFFYTRTVPCELWFLDKSKSLLPSPTGEGLGVRARRRRAAQTPCSCSMPATSTAKSRATFHMRRSCVASRGRTFHASHGSQACFY